MNAIVMRTPGDPDVLRATRVPVPRPGKDQVLLRVRAAVVTQPVIRSGKSPAIIPTFPISDASGEVILVGRGVTGWSRGHRVIAVGDSIGRIQPGRCADYLVVSSGDLHAIPDNVSFLGAVSVGRTFAAAWSALVEDGRLGLTERAVVIGAAHPIGIAAVQICRWRDSPVIAVANGRHAPRLGALGTTRTISQSAPDLAGHVIAGLGGRPANVVLNVTGEKLSESLQMLDRHGRLVLTSGGGPRPLDLHLLVDRHAHVMGSSARVDEVDISHILELLSEGTFLPVIDSIFPLSHATRAHQRTESPEVFGSVLLVPDHLFQSTQKITQPREEG
jgi:NADPH:quinone reductase-like Zn-dependent oxidoreductase